MMMKIKRIVKKRKEENEQKGELNIKLHFFILSNQKSFFSYENIPKSTKAQKII